MKEVTEAGAVASKKKMSICLLIPLVLSVLYFIYLVSYFGRAIGGSSSDAEAVGAGIATFLVFPHMLLTFLGVVFNALGLFMRKRGLALTGGILYAVAIACFPLYFMFLIVQVVLSFVGFARMPKK